MIRNILLIVLSIPVLIFAQAEYVSADNPVYDFLYRMESLQIIENYNQFEIPKTRREIANHLKIVIENELNLDDIDKKILNDLKTEFGYDLFGTLDYSESIIGTEPYNLLGEQEKYLFYYEDPGAANLFINLFSEGELITRIPGEGKSNSTTLGLIGGEIRGTFLEKFGFFLRGFQGQVFGSRETARLRKSINYNFKYNLEPGDGFFDETAGYMSADFNLIKLKLGRDRLNIGHGALKPLMSSNAPMFDYLSLNLKYKFLNFSYYHGKLIGNITQVSDTITGGSNIVTEKYWGYHRLAFDLSSSFSFGAGEIIIYGDRGIDLTYLNPFTFYKSIEHSNQDRDNSMLFFDINYKPVKGLKIFGTLLIDDIRFGEIGSGWWGNQTMLHAGIASFNLYKILPADIRFEYVRIEPYTFTHRFIRNSYTHNGFMPGLDLQPNSELFFTQINYRFNHRFNFSAGFQYGLHGANPIDESGNVTGNVGGDVSLGHRVFDPETAEFLDGDLEHLRRLIFDVSFEPVNQLFFLFRLMHLNESLQNSVKINETHLFLTLMVRI
jgi:hypothetical protein